jgi:hypothetical protein
MSAPPNILPDASYSGLFYAYEGSGGFILEQGIASTTIFPYNKVNRYDVTNSLQVTFDVRTFNTKIGLLKDASNDQILSTTYDDDLMNFPTDSITISALDFSSAVRVPNILSVGFYSTMYSNFQTLVNNYFGVPSNFNALFTTSSTVTINNGVFDASSMVNVMNYSAQNASGEYIKTMTGEIKIANINALLRYACENNPFGNRSPAPPTIAGGFKENDLVYVPNGTTITLVAKIINADSSSNNIIPTTQGLTSIINSSPGPDFVNNDYSQTTTFTSSAITRVIKVPILMVLKDLSDA